MHELSALWRDDNGTSTLEMAIMLALVAVVGICAWQTYGDAIAGSSALSTQTAFGADAAGSVPPPIVPTTD